MEKFLTFILGAALWYGVFSFIVWEPNEFAWHWGVRLVYSLFVIGTMRSVFKED
jgi:hypothetical protein